MKENMPLVSIIIITYNSSKYVVETLESARNQTYKNIELIISDDASTDNTVEICRNWLEKYDDRFVRTEIIIVESNQGISKNINRGLYAATGDWVKPIAGDDTLTKRCIEDNYAFVKQEKGRHFCFSNFNTYRDVMEPQNLIPENQEYDTRSRIFSELNQEFQSKVLVRNVIVLGPTTFYNRKIIIENGGYDESYPFIEDRTSFYKWSIAGIKFHYLPSKTVNYRVHLESISNVKANGCEISKFSIKVRDMIYERFYKYFTVKERIFYHLKYSYYRFFGGIDRLNVFGRIFRRSWYFLVQWGDRYNYNSLHRLHKEYLKFMRKLSDYPRKSK